ncbi:MAG: hypothetical protein ABL986_16735 [Vicinamibacterales bacterium]
MLRDAERVAYLEGQVNEHSNTFSDMRETMRHFENRMDVRFESVDRRLEQLDQKMSRQFLWLVGVQMTTLVAMVGALMARG